MKNIRLYELESEYKREGSSLEFPTVSYTKNTSKVWYTTKPNILRAWFLIEEENLIEGPDGTEGYFTLLYGFDPTFTAGPATPFNVPYTYGDATYNGIESLFKIVIDDQEIIDGDNLVTLKEMPIYKWETLGRHKVDYYFTNDCNDLHSIFGDVGTTDNNRRLLPVIHVNFDRFDTKNLECLYNSFSIIGQDLWLSVETTEDGEISWDVITDSLDGTVITKPRYAKALFNLCNKNFDKLKVKTKCFPNGYAILYVDSPYLTTFRNNTPDIIIYVNTSLDIELQGNEILTLPYSKVYSNFQNHRISVFHVGSSLQYDYEITDREVLLRIFNNIDLIEQEMVRLPVNLTDLFSNGCYYPSEGYKTCPYKGIYNFLANEGSSWVDKLNSEFGLSGFYVTNGDGYIELGFERPEYTVYIRVNPNDEVESNWSTCD